MLFWWCDLKRMRLIKMLRSLDIHIFNSHNAAMLSCLVRGLFFEFMRNGSVWNRIEPQPTERP